MPRALTVKRLLALYSAERLAQQSTGERTERSLTILLAQDLRKAAPELSPDDIMAAVERVATTGRTHANRCLAYLRAFFGWAMRNGYLDANPALEVPMPAVEIVRERDLTLDEIVDVWRSTEVLDYPFSPAIRVMLLTGMQRERVASMRHQDVEYGELGGMGTWRLPAHPSDFAKVFVVALPDLARWAIFQSRGRASRRSPYVFSTTGDTPVSGWTRAKRKLDVEISRRRTAAGRPEMPAWRLDDLRRSLVANVEEHFLVDHGLAMSCLHVQSRFGSLKQRFIAYSGCVDGYRAEILAAWARLVDEASRPGALVEKALSRVQSEAMFTLLAAWRLDDSAVAEVGFEEVLEELYRRGFKERRIARGDRIRL
jgi:hypothetical protein